ncbi:MAG: two-component regulator propeller domain-containing protein [Bacteroidota bacterium]
MSDILLRAVYLLKNRGLVTIISLLLSFGLLAQTPSSINYSIEQGLLSSEVYCMLQDRAGHLWIGTDKGLNRFDGFRMESYTTANGLADKNVLQLAQDQDGRIWLLSYNGKLSFWKNGKFYNEENCELLKNASAKSFFESFLQDRKGDLWFGTNEHGLFKINKRDHHREAIAFANDPTRRIKEEISYIFEDSNGAVFHTGDKGIYQVMDNKSHLIYSIPNYKTRINCYYAPNQEVLYFTGENKLFCYVLKEKKAFCIQTFPSVNIINRIRRNSGEELWLATDNGVFLVDSKGKISDHLLEGKKTSDVLLDEEDNLWVSTLYSGIYLIKNRAILNYETKAKNAILKKGNGILFGGAEMELHEIVDNHLIKKPLHFNKNVFISRQDQIKVLAEDTKGRLWLGANRGLFKLEEAELRLQYYSVIHSIHFDKSYVYFSHRKGTSKIMGDDLERISLAFQKNIPVSKNPIRKYMINSFTIDTTKAQCFYKKGEKELLVGTAKGMMTIEEGRFQYPKEGHPFPKGDIISIKENSEGILWILYAKKGLFYYDAAKDELVAVKVADDLKNLAFTAMELDENHDAWLASNHGLFHIIKQKEQFVPEHFQKTHGLQTNDINDLTLKNDALWLATTQGITLFPRNYRKKKMAPRFYIDSIYANGSVLSLKQPLSLSHKKNNISVSYHGISFKGEGKLSYHYNLSGKRSEAGVSESRQLTFNDLPPSAYELIIYAVDYDGNKSTVQTIAFDIAVPWWREWWALSTFSTLILIFSYQSIKHRRVRRDQELIRESTTVPPPILKQEPFIILKSVLDGSNVKINLDEILFIAAARDYMEIHLATQKILVRSTMKGLEEKLQIAPSLIRIHKSYIANLEHARAIKRNEIRINDTLLPISRTYSTIVKEYLKAMEKKSEN